MYTNNTDQSWRLTIDVIQNITTYKKGGMTFSAVHFRVLFLYLDLINN